MVDAAPSGPDKVGRHPPIEFFLRAIHTLSLPSQYLDAYIFLGRTIVKNTHNMKESESSSTLRTTPTMRRKAHVVQRLVISILKFWRMCKCGKKTSGKHKAAQL